MIRHCDQQDRKGGRSIRSVSSALRWGSLLLVGAALFQPVASFSQGNDNDHTPLGSRIRRDRQFPTDLPPQRFTERQLGEASRARSKTMLSQFSYCIYNRSKSESVDLLNKTDYGFGSFEQIGLTNEKAARIYGFSDCLSRVASANATGVMLNWTTAGLRQWVLREAYFDRYRKGPDWVKPGNVIGERSYVLSGPNPPFRMVLDFADCVVATDPYSADFYFRTSNGSADEKRALDDLTPSLGPCLPAGQRVSLSPDLLRQWLGEALWHAAQHSAPADPISSEVAK